MPENLTALSRDTKNANAQAEKQDLQKMQERQEMAKVLGEIVDNGITIDTFEKREKLTKLSRDISIKIILHRNNLMQFIEEKKRYLVLHGIIIKIQDECN